MGTKRRELSQAGRRESLVLTAITRTKGIRYKMIILSPSDVETTHTGWRKSLRFSKLYNRVSLRKGPQAAKVSIARELAGVSFYVLKYQKAFKDYKR